MDDRRELVVRRETVPVSVERLAKRSLAFLDRPQSCVLHFPSDYSLGWLYYLDEEGEFSEEFADAQGRVVVPDCRPFGWKAFKVTDEQLGEVDWASLTNMQTLDLSHTQVTDAGLKHLSGLNNLQTLYLGGTQVTDAGLKHLSGLTNLQMIDLSGTQVTDAGRAKLQQLFTWEVMFG